MRKHRLQIRLAKAVSFDVPSIEFDLSRRSLEPTEFQASPSEPSNKCLVGLSLVSAMLAERCIQKLFMPVHRDERARQIC
jgi:hypothetical protein